MGFKKHNWMSYGRQGEIVEIKIMDNSGGKIDFFRCNSKTEYPKIIKLLKDKYGFSPTIEVTDNVGESVNHMNEMDLLD